MRLTDEKIKTLLEENVGLKSYIENMNTECLELNAALFDEANKMVIAARSKQHNAEKRAKERAQENELLRSQLDELRTVIASLPSPVETCGSPTVLGKSPLSRSEPCARFGPFVSRFRFHTFVAIQFHIVSTLDWLLIDYRVAFDNTPFSSPYRSHIDGCDVACFGL
ncbi:uncharacterized protein DEA37_0015067 [Paragonimus westermani]|uniref:GDP/GTP exchange factor Sec2 N-terminal domain-containing protein n=1 Tax=Paragonimus westermani TaxID=34504 RepID=A0A5J4NSE3_9TREM|nr:uncharacterized protein DEA37_0015067 [Paragonimus westermani]